MAQPFTVEVKGLKSAQATIAELAKLFPQETLRAVNYRAELIMTDSKKNYCPVDQGVLKGSGHVVVDADKKEVVLGYGGPAGIGNVGGETNREAVGYAVVQHENTDYRHTVGTSGYLRKPAAKAAPTLARDVAKDVNGDRLAAKAKVVVD